jgi:hypothetical protein
MRQLALSVDLHPHQKLPSWALANSPVQISKLVMLQLVSRVQGRLLACGRKVPPRKSGPGSIQDNKQPTNRTNKSLKDRGPPLSSRGASLTGRPLSTKGQKF